jgi:predicted molibdopterin-dependent oxidoreductase YjgC
MARDYFQQGPIAVVYDDSFPEVDAKGEALTAVATLVDAIAAKTAVGVIPMLDDCNSMGARDLGVLPDGGSWRGSTVSALLKPGSPIRAALILGSNIVRDVSDPSTFARLGQLDLLVVDELMMTETARHAHVILPAASFAEKRGTFTNTERRVQQLTQAVPAPGIARADWEILVDLSQYFDQPLDYALPQEVWEDIRRAVPAYASITHADIGMKGVRPSALVLSRD